MRIKSLLISTACVLAAMAGGAQTTRRSGPWELEDSGSSAGLRGIHAVGGGVVWASGTGGTILRSEDTGYLWQQCTTPPGASKLDFRGIWAWDAQNVLALSSGPGDQSRLFRTTDGCNSWKLLLTNPDAAGFWDGLLFLDPQHGVLYGDPVPSPGRSHHADLTIGLLVTHNGGNSWSPAAPLEPLPGESIFAASNSAMAAQKEQIWLGTSKARVLRTSSMDNWQSAQTPLASGNDSSGVFSLAFRDQKHGIAVGGDYRKPEVATATAAYTSDGGEHWIAARKPPHGYRSAVAWDEKDQAWITAGSNGSDISYDDGETWQWLDSGNWNALSLPWAVGPNGQIGKLGTLPPQLQEDPGKLGGGTMAEYVVKLADERGRIQEQVQIAGSAEELRSRFSQAGYDVYSVRPRGMRGVGGSRKRANLEAFIIFNQQFLTLIRAGLPIVGSLDMLVKGQKNPTFRAQLENVAARVRTGESLSGAFEAQGGFPLIYTTTLLAGERSGQLEDVLSRYLSFQRISLSFRKKLMASLLYPCLLITMVLALFVFLISFVVPRFAMLYDQLGTNLPAATRMLLAVGNNFQHYILWVLAGIAVIIYLLFRYSQTAAGAARIDRMRIGMPVFGNIWRKYQVALFVRTLSSLLVGGLPPVPSLETAARSISSNTIAKAVMASVGTVREGKSLAQSLEKTGVFPDLAVEMIDVGESTGALPQMLNSVAEFFEEDVQTALTAALALIEPAILIVMGSVVVVILIALYLPIFSLGQASTMGGH